MTPTPRWLALALMRAVLVDRAKAIWREIVFMHTCCWFCGVELGFGRWLGPCPDCEHKILPPL